MKRFAFATMLAVLCWGSKADAQTYYFDPGTNTYVQNQTYFAPGVIQVGAYSYSPWTNTTTNRQYYNNYNDGSYGYSNSYYNPYRGYNYNYGYNNGFNNGYNNYRPYNSGFSYGNRSYYNGNYGRSYWRR